MARKRFSYADFCADLALFGLQPDAAATFTQATLKGRYTTRVKEVHPDKPGGSTEKAAALNAANDRLKDWIKRGRPAWPEQGSEPPRPDPAAAAARAAREAEAARQREAEADRKRAADAAAAMREAQAAAAEAEQRRRARAEQEQATEAARQAAAEAKAREAAAREQAEAARRLAEAEAARVRLTHERAARRRRVLLWPVVTPARAVGAAAGRVRLPRLALLAAIVGSLYGWPTIRASHLAASLPAVPYLGPIRFPVPSIPQTAWNWGRPQPVWVNRPLPRYR